MPLVPWFVIAFAGAVAVRSAGLLPATALDLGGPATTLLLSNGLFGLRTGFMVEDIWPLPWAALDRSPVVPGLSRALVVTLI